MRCCLHYLNVMVSLLEIAKRLCDGNLSYIIHPSQLQCLLSGFRFKPRKTSLVVLRERVSQMCTIGSASLITCYLRCYKWQKINCFSTFEVKLVSTRQCVSRANGGWWHTDQYYSLEQTSTAEGAIRPQRCLSALWYTLEERGCGDGKGGRIWWVHAA